MEVVICYYLFKITQFKQNEDILVVFRTDLA